MSAAGPEWEFDDGPAHKIAACGATEMPTPDLHPVAPFRPRTVVQTLARTT